MEVDSSMLKMRRANRARVLRGSTVRRVAVLGHSGVRWAEPNVRMKAYALRVQAASFLANAAEAHSFSRLTDNTLHPFAS